MRQNETGKFKKMLTKTEKAGSALHKDSILSTGPSRLNTKQKGTQITTAYPVGDAEE